MTDPGFRLIGVAEWWRTAPRIFGVVPVLAWVHGFRTEAPEIRVLWGFGSMERVTHECMHILHGGNEIHHPWWHFCILVRHPARLNIHVDEAAYAMAARLRAT